MPVAVSTTCPFCGGSSPLLKADEELTTVELIERFRGKRLTCPNPECEKPFAIRHGDLKIRRESQSGTRWNRSRGD